MMFVSSDPETTWSLSAFQERELILDVWNAHLVVTKDRSASLRTCTHRSRRSNQLELFVVHVDGESHRVGHDNVRRRHSHRTWAVVQFVLRNFSALWVEHDELIVSDHCAELGSKISLDRLLRQRGGSGQFPRV
ncbi:hypothetical protein OGATHE_002878 [Ogataea polymorpha]|uniref:Uncharacterized protein n=1 Tax=Ogataea polymorpha TaxID=460523 RepID=A0A9P8PE91_9ASCO|nr:hypothetical protein OGATHE_002878 [Ogataea polymorpha]